jgi:hypothetical protein
MTLFAEEWQVSKPLLRLNIVVCLHREQPPFYYGRGFTEIISFQHREPLTHYLCTLGIIQVRHVENLTQG